MGKVREERRDEAREDLEIERNLILSQAVDALAERRGINRLNSNLFKSTTLHAAAIATYAACENNALLHIQRRIRASVAYELASLMIIDDAERIERRMRLEDNEDDAFEYATLVAEGAARVLQNARIRGSMRKFAYKLIAYKGGVLDAALEEERAAIERELIAVDDEFGAAVYDEFLEAVNRCEEMWCPAKPHFVTIENKTTCTPALFLAMDAARERIHEVAAELDRQYPRPAETSYVLADELRMFVEIAARHALKRAGVDVPKKHRGARVALRRFIARAKDAASRFVERLVRNPDDPDGQTMNAFADALFGDVAAMLRSEGATHRSAKGARGERAAMGRERGQRLVG